MKKNPPTDYVSDRTATGLPSTRGKGSSVFEYSASEPGSSQVDEVPLPVNFSVSEFGAFSHPEVLPRGDLGLRESRYGQAVGEISPLKLVEREKGKKNFSGFEVKKHDTHCSVAKRQPADPDRQR